MKFDSFLLRSPLRNFGGSLQESVEELLVELDFINPSTLTETELLTECRRLLNSLLDGAMALKRL